MNSNLQANAIVRAEALQAIPWKNSGGITREIAASPRGAALDTFDWRISIADVEQSGAFSIFPGIDRVLTVIDGAGMLLTDDNANTRYKLSCWQPFAFAGETSINAELSGGVTRDFNLMLRRDRVTGAVYVHRSVRHLSVAHGTVVLYCAAGGFIVNAAGGEFHSQHLSQGDSFVIDVDRAHDIDIAPASYGAILLDARIIPTPAIAKDNNIFTT